MLGGDSEGGLGYCLSGPATSDIVGLRCRHPHAEQLDNLAGPPLRRALWRAHSGPQLQPVAAGQPERRVRASFPNPPPSQPPPPARRARHPPRPSPAKTISLPPLPPPP